MARPCCLGDHERLCDASEQPPPRSLSPRCVLSPRCLCTARAGSAQPRSELYERGTQSLNAGRYDEAAQTLDASYREEQTPVVLYNLGLAYKGMGHPTRRCRPSRATCSFANPAKDRTPRSTPCAPRSNAIKTGYARFALKLTPADATDHIDGPPASSDHDELWVQTGRHKISVPRQRLRDYEQTLDVTAGPLRPRNRPARARARPDVRAAELIDEGVALQARAAAMPAIDKYAPGAGRSTRRPSARALMGLTEEQVGDAGAPKQHLD